MPFLKLRSKNTKRELQLEFPFFQERFLTLSAHAREGYSSRFVRQVFGWDFGVGGPTG